MYRLRVLVTAASMPGASCAAVVGHRGRVGITRRLGGSPVRHRSCTPCRHRRYTAPASTFVRRIGWRETEFAQQCAQGNVHLHVGERRADAMVDAAAERNSQFKNRVLTGPLRCCGGGGEHVDNDSEFVSGTLRLPAGDLPRKWPANPQAYTSDPPLQHDCGMKCRTTSPGGDDHVLALRGAAIAAGAATHTSRVRTSFRCQPLHNFKAIGGPPRCTWT
jgi:hypothetical protein